jgi:hypothetical protein
MWPQINKKIHYMCITLSSKRIFGRPEETKRNSKPYQHIALSISFPAVQEFCNSDSR